MSTPQHTPGPWHVRTIDESIGSIDAADGTSVAQAQMRGTLRNHNHEERRANTRLIASAPDLLFALDQAVTSMQDSGYPNSHLAVRCARAAIARATGKEPA